MQIIEVNEMRPTISKMAWARGKKLTNVRKELYEGSMTLMCKLDGVRMPVTEARKKLLEGVRFVYLNGSPCDV